MVLLHIPLISSFTYFDLFSICSTTQIPYKFTPLNDENNEARLLGKKTADSSDTLQQSIDEKNRAVWFTLMAVGR